MRDNGKITALRNAVAGTGGLIDQLSALSKNNGDVYISVDPVREGRQPRLQQLWPELSRLDRLAQSADHTAQQRQHPGEPADELACSRTRRAMPVDQRQRRLTRARRARPARPARPTFLERQRIRATFARASITTCTRFTMAAGSARKSAPACSARLGTRVHARRIPRAMRCPAAAAKLPVASTVHRQALYARLDPARAPTTTSTTKNQPRVSAVVGWTNNQWTSTNKTPTVVNNWQQPSTNPISTWTGCVTDRTQPNDATGVLPTSSDVTTLFPANEYYREQHRPIVTAVLSTPLGPVIPLSYDWSSLKNAVNAMQPTGGTDQSVGLAWAWQSLLVGGPLNTPAEDSNTTYNRVIIPLSGRSEHRGPLARLRRRQLAGLGQSDRCQAGTAMPEPPGREGFQGPADVHDLHHPGEHELARRSDLDRPEELRQQPRQILHADQSRPRS